MKHLKKLFALSLILVLIVAAFAGCGLPGTGNEQNNNDSASQGDDNNDSADNGGEIVLRVVDWSDSSFTEREKFNQKFMEKHPNVKIEYTMLTIDQFKNTILTMIKSGDGPDLFPIPSGMTLKTALDEEWYQPMDDYLTDEFLETINPDAFQEGITMQDGKIYSIPEIAPVISAAIYYNKDVLEAAGVTELPKTYSEFIEVCKQVTEAGKGQFYGLIEGGKQLNRLEIMARAFAGVAGGKVAGESKVLTVNGRAPYDSEEMKGVFELFAQLAQDGSIHPDTMSINAPEAREMFAQGQAAFLMQGMWCIPPWEENYPDLNYGIMGVPAPDSGAKGAVQMPEWSPWMGIYKQSEHPELAAEYLMALYSEEYGYQSGCVSNGNFVSIVPSINEKYMTNEVMKQYYEVATEISKVVPSATKRDPKAYNFYAEVKDIQPSLGSILQGVIAGNITDYESALTQLSNASTEEWKRAAEAVGLDYSVFEFPNWDPTKDYTNADYEALD